MDTGSGQAKEEAPGGKGVEKGGAGKSAKKAGTGLPFKQPQKGGGERQSGGSTLGQPPSAAAGGKSAEKDGEGAGGQAAGAESAAESGRDPSAGSGASRKRPEETAGEAMPGAGEGEPLPGGTAHDPRLADSPVAPPSEVADRVYLQMKAGDETEGRASKRLTLSPAEGVGGDETQAPARGIDPAARLSDEQAGEDAVRPAPVPLEYREILRRINSGTP